MAYFLLNKNSKQLAAASESILLSWASSRQTRQRRSRSASGFSLGSSLCRVLSAISSLSLTIFSFLSTLCSLLSTFACQASRSRSRTEAAACQPAGTTCFSCLFMGKVSALIKCQASHPRLSSFCLYVVYLRT